MGINGTIFKSLSGFYYVETETGTIECKARGRFRLMNMSPLVGDKVSITITEAEKCKGTIEEILPRKNEFIRPSVANIELMVIIASNAIPATDPFLIDRVTAIAEYNDCECIICINKCDLKSGEGFYEIYSRSGFKTICTSAVTGEGIDTLSNIIAGKICAFTGNSGVGKSSILNAIDPDLEIKVGEVSQKLGRGRHTTRHVELFRLGNGAIVADTPGFSSFDTEAMDLVLKENLQFAFHEFAPYIGKCQFNDCSHTKEKGCAILEAMERGEIQPTRHSSYIRLYEHAKKTKQWELKK